MNNRPLVSILLPIYNAETFLKECLDSIFNQTYVNYEIIAINDGSEDNPDAVIANFKDSRLHYYKNESNFGISKTLNKAIEMAKGEYLMRMDADDLILPNKLNTQIEYLLIHPDIEILGTSFSQLNHTKPLYNNLPESDILIKLEMFFRFPLCHASVIYRKGVFSHHNNYYPEDINTAEDYDLMVRAFMKGIKFANLPDKLYIYRQHENQNTDRYYDELVKLDDIIRLKIATHFFENILEEFGQELYLNFINSRYGTMTELQKIKKMVFKIKRLSIAYIPSNVVNKFWQEKWAYYLLQYCYKYINTGIKNSMRLVLFYLMDKSFYTFKGMKKKIRFLFVCLKIK